MRGLVWLSCLIAACSGYGIYVEVQINGLEVASVELVLADGLCKLADGSSCDRLQGKAFKAAVDAPGHIFKREAARETTTIEDGSAWFEIPAGDRTLDMVFALGRDANRNIVGVAVMPDTLDLREEPVIYRVVLDPAQPLLPRQPVDTAVTAEWSTDADQCIGVRPVNPGDLGPIFIVPADNPDCDGATGEGECDPLWYDGFSFDESTAAHCSQPSQVIPGACVLGHVPACVENQSAEISGCVESNQCLPTAVCECGVFDEACQETKLRAHDVDARLDCSVPGETDASVDVIFHCSSDNTFRIPPSAELSIGGRCVAAELIATPDATFHSERGAAFSAPTAKFEVTDHDDQTCAITMKWEGQLLPTQIEHTVLVVTIERSDLSTRELWIPINFLPTLQCPTSPGSPGTGCTYVDVEAPDALTSCAM